MRSLKTMRNVPVSVKVPLITRDYQSRMRSLHSQPLRYLTARPSGGSANSNLKIRKLIWMQLTSLTQTSFTWLMLLWVRDQHPQSQRRCHALDEYSPRNGKSFNCEMKSDRDVSFLNVNCPTSLCAVWILNNLKKWIWIIMLSTTQSMLHIFFFNNNSYFIREGKGK